MAEQKPKNIYATTPKGYLRHRKDSDGRLRMEHDLVWEEHFGKIPEGMQIHHKDFDKTNNDISNLQMVTPLEHKRLHSGCIKRGDIWYKPCKVCGEYKACDSENWYFSRGWPTGKICKRCYVKKVVEDRQERRKNGWVRKEYRKPVRKHTAQMNLFLEDDCRQIELAF